MSPSLRVLPNALVLALLAAASLAAPASAQFYNTVQRSLDFSNEVARSPRLLGMGRLSLVIPDRDNGINLWDFAHNPIGIAYHDSSSTLDIRPGTSSADGMHDESGYSRQDLGGRGTRVGFELFHRDDGNAFGATAALDAISMTTPFASDEAVERSVGHPDISPIMTGHLPYLGKDKLRYALRMRFGGDHQRDKYRTLTTNAAGQFLTLDGETLNPPNVFTPDEVRVNVSSMGGLLAYPIGKSHTIAIGLDGVRELIKGSNNGFRYSGEQRERRPYGVGQASLLGHFGEKLEYGIDGRGCVSQSNEDWVFSISAGVGALPLEGRGKLLSRDERGSQLNSRVRWTSGKVELGGQLWTQASRVTIDAPNIGDYTSFNRFLDLVFYRANSDTLVRPDSVSNVRLSEYAWGYAGGGSYRLKKGVVGVEYHFGRDLQQSDRNGKGPKSIQWDVRSGLEYACTPVLTSRVGYAYRWVDRDDFTRANEYLGHTVTAGFGLRPKGTSWTVETGYAIEWLRSDFGDPSLQRSSRQDLSMQVHWQF